ncbi:MAG: PilN domain-containing protein [Vicinamibacteria bacterium]
MIRVNLLGTKEAPAGGGTVIDSGPASGERSERKGVVVAVAILGLAAAAIVFQYLSASRELSQLEQEINQLTAEKNRLAPIIVEVQRYQAKLAELEEKEKLIERLKSEREGPVRMLDSLSAELPDFVWLTQLQQRGSQVTIDGMAASYVSIADYIRKLEDSEWFQNVELVDARVDQQQEQEFTQFQLRTQLISPNAPPPAAPAATPAGASPAGAR